MRNERKKKFGEEITTSFILTCILGVIAFGALLVMLMKWMGAS